ncbi:unnamed protein product [Allacma fusca]|uniref:SID1 transmembrane family member 1 n=1 Tax=Allacma fusca TaxID=39272 RepID=A0A8J2JL34_9HEXA|nr:unnamed protein product [Allacma fusca]
MPALKTLDEKCKVPNNSTNTNVNKTCPVIQGDPSVGLLSQTQNWPQPYYIKLVIRWDSCQNKCQLRNKKVILWDCFANHLRVDVDRPHIETKVITGEFNKTDVRDVTDTIVYVYQYTFNKSDIRNETFSGDIRVHVEILENTDPDFPVMFVVRQQKQVLSWQLPVQDKVGKQSITYNVASRTLCSDTFSSNSTDDDEQTVFATVSTSSKRRVRFSITVFIEANFIMQLNTHYETDISPPSPRFFQFKFPPTASHYVLLEVLSEDTICMTVSVQNMSCPVRDQQNNVQFKGYWQTMMTKAGMTIQKEDFPFGFYVVFVVHSDDTECTKDARLITMSSKISPRVKNVVFMVNEKITDDEYIIATFGTIGVFSLFYMLAFFISCCYMFRNNPVEFPVEDAVDSQNNERETEDINRRRETSPILSGGRPILTSTPYPSQKTEPRDDIDNNTASTSQTQWLVDSDSSLDETDIDMLEDANTNKDVYRTNAYLCVAALARKNPRVLGKKAQLYLWTLLTVAIFYALPVVQLVFTYQKVLHTTGNQDLCYYNYLCSHPFWVLSDFNHVFSNVGYLMLGVLFILLVIRRNRMHEQLLLMNNGLDTHYGIPRHFGLFYAMGVALIMEGVLSACYHVCPNHSNFQFDTCFMYVNSILCILKIYQTRHPDINASAYMTFASLAVVVLIGVLGVMAGSIYFWIFFTTLHVFVCFFLSVQVYYLGRWRLDGGMMKRVYITWRNDCLAGPLSCLRPLYIDRMVLLIIANGANWAIAGYGVYRRSHDFASHLLLIFMANLLLYIVFYIIMKITHRERILCQSFIYIILSVVFWSMSLFVFIHRSTSWQMTPAESRTFNRECMILRFYDTHDIWHFLSAASMFFSFMILLTLDDDLINTPRTKIPVF